MVVVVVAVVEVLKHPSPHVPSPLRPELQQGSGYPGQPILNSPGARSVRDASF